MAHTPVESTIALQARARVTISLAQFLERPCDLDQVKFTLLYPVRPHLEAGRLFKKLLCHGRGQIDARAARL